MQNSPHSPTDLPFNNIIIPTEITIPETEEQGRVSGPGPAESNKFRFLQHRQVFQSLTPLGKYIFIIRHIFVISEIIWIISLLSLFWDLDYSLAPHVRTFLIMFIIWLLFAVISLGFPYYYCITQPHFDVPDAIEREGKKKEIYTYFDLFFMVPGIFNAVLLFNMSGKISQTNVYIYYTSLVWLVLLFSYTFFPALLATLAIFCLPCIFIVLRNAQVREEARIRALGASEDLINSIPLFKFRSRKSHAQDPPIIPMSVDPSPVNLEGVSSSAVTIPPKRIRFRLFNYIRNSKQPNVNSNSAEPSKFIEMDSALATCAICLIDYEDDEILRQLPCGHHFHKACVDEWLQRNGSCPSCRSKELATKET